MKPPTSKSPLDHHLGEYFFGTFSIRIVHKQIRIVHKYLPKETQDAMSVYLLKSKGHPGTLPVIDRVILPPVIGGDNPRKTDFFMAIYRGYNSIYN